MYGLLGEPIQTDNGDLYSDYLSSISIVDENRLQHRFAKENFHESNHMTDLRGKATLVTGSARGIGKAIAERLESLGANIVVDHSSHRKNARVTVENIRKQSVRALAIKADITKLLN
jgi:lactate dehydrogenase-like 2-hydroxyacid dehydrogenase